MRFLIFLLTFTFTFSAFSNPANLDFFKVKPITPKPVFAMVPYTNKAHKIYNARVSNNGRFAIATFKTNSPATLAKQILRKNPYAILGLTALAFFQDENEEFYKPPEINSTIPDEFQQPPKFSELWQCSGPNNSTTTSTSIGGCASWAATEWQKTKPTELVRSVSGVVLEHNLLAAKYDWCGKYAYHNSTCTRWDKNQQVGTGSATPLPPEPSCPSDAYPNHIKPYNDKCVEQEVFDLYHPTKATLPQMASALSNHINNNPDTVQDFSPFKERDTDEFLSPDSIDSVNQPNVSDQFNEYLKSVASGNHQSSSPDLPNYVPAEFVQPTQAAIKATEQGQPLVDPTTDDIIDPDITQPDPAPTPTPNPNLPYEITVNVPEDDTISQTEYEQSNAKFFEDFKAAADPSTQEIETLLKTSADGDKDFIDSLTTDVTNADIPALPLIADLWPNVSTGQCIPFTLNVSLRGQPKTITFDKHCPPYNTYVNPILTYFLYIITALYVLHLAGRTFARTVS
ncbi:hypothetical protein AADZ84_17165 [Colwelliaceae bacterium MEBiC 14330]